MAAKKTPARNTKTPAKNAGPVAEVKVEEEIKVAETVVEDSGALVDKVVEEESIVEVLSEINGIARADKDGRADEVELRVTKSKFNPSDKVPLKSLFHGKLVYTSPTNSAKWIWKEYGSVVHVPFGELETMNNQKPRFLNDPLLVIMEPDVVEEFNFGETYRKVAGLTKLGNMLEGNNVEAIRKVVRGLLEVGMRNSVIAEARQCREKDKLNNINVINMLNKELNTDIS